MPEVTQRAQNALARILFFVPGLRAGSDGILHAQVLTPAAVLSQNGFECFFVGAEPAADWAQQSEQRIKQQYGLACKVCVCGQRSVPYFGLVWQARAVAAMSHALMSEWKPDFIYCREFYCVRAVKGVAQSIKASIVLDVRGLIAEEAALKRGRGLRYRFLAGSEQKGIRQTSRLCCVSQNLKEWINQTTGRRDVEVIPCCVNTRAFAFRPRQRVALRRRWAIADDELLFCYSGGLGTWQRIEDVIRLFAHVSVRIPKARFLFLTKQQDRINAMLTALPSAEKSIVTGCDHDRVAEYLSAADVGVIMRHNVLVNNVASPVKIAEYLACGLPVLLTRGIGDYSQTIPQDGLGLLLEDDGQDAQRIQQFLENLNLPAHREKAALYAARHLSWAAHLPTFQRLYSRLYPGPGS